MKFSWHLPVYGLVLSFTCANTQSSPLCTFWAFRVRYWLKARSGFVVSGIVVWYIERSADREMGSL